MNEIVNGWQLQRKVDHYFEMFRNQVGRNCAGLAPGCTLKVQVGSAKHDFEWPKTVEEMMVILEPDLRKALLSGELD